MKSLPSNVSFPNLEREVLAYWDKNSAFERSVQIRKDAPEFRFYDGPPFATGTPHYGHLLAGTIKDIIPRYATMRGFSVERRFGWDTHGLPIEMATEKALGLNGRKSILEFGIDKFNEACRAGVLKYVDEWRRVTNRIGRWIDFDNDYKTMDVWFMESVWWVFKQLWDSDRIYLTNRVMPYSWRLSTPLSNFEASSNYKTVQDPAITVKFKLLDDPQTAFLAWTTTPWTLPTNTGLCVLDELTYVKVKVDSGEHYILAETCVEAILTGVKHEVVESYKGSELVGKQYIPLFPYCLDQREHGAFRVASDSFVTTDSGTGIVHMNPAHGEDDNRVCAREGIPLVDAVDDDGNFRDLVTDFAGQNVKEADKPIIAWLKEHSLLVKHDTISHSYPFCERSDTPLIYKTISAWYVRVSDVRSEMLKNNSAIHWVPEHIKDGRFGNWLADARDWNISRNRFWGNPLPIWRCDECADTVCVGSRAELQQFSGTLVDDLHKHFVDPITWSCSKCSGTMRRTPEVLDCWFESGAMPYAQKHYPFENQASFEASFPADFIAEGLDQTRGWFYTLTVLSTLLFKSPAFKNVIVNGLILAEDGKKMSKSLQNYPDPSLVMEEHGADALRMYLINSPAVHGEPLRFSEQGVREVVRSVILPFWNAYSFFVTYALIDNYKPSADLTGSKNILDRWILSRYQTLQRRILSEMEEYHLYSIAPCLLDFLDELTNWYIRRSRARFWSGTPEDKQAAFDTLHYVLLNYAKSCAPFMPFLSESIYQNLATLTQDSVESVHHTEFPQPQESLEDVELEAEIALVQRVIWLGRALRAKEKVKTRQPLQSFTIINRNTAENDTLQRYIDNVKEELNVKEVIFKLDERDFVTLSVKPDFPKCGKIFGTQMKALQAELAALSEDVIHDLEEGKSITVLEREIDKSILQINRTVRGNISMENSGGISVFFDMTITPELLAEGRAREFVNRVQKMRKEAELEISDRIVVAVAGADELLEALRTHNAYIQEELLATQFTVGSGAHVSGKVEEQEIDDLQIAISLRKA